MLRNPWKLKQVAIVLKRFFYTYFVWSKCLEIYPLKPDVCRYIHNRSSVIKKSHKKWHIYGSSGATRHYKCRPICKEYTWVDPDWCTGGSRPIENDFLQYLKTRIMRVCLAEKEVWRYHKPSGWKYRNRQTDGSGRRQTANTALTHRVAR